MSDDWKWFLGVYVPAYIIGSTIGFLIFLWMVGLIPAYIPGSIVGCIILLWIIGVL